MTQICICVYCKTQFEYCSCFVKDIRDLDKEFEQEKINRENFQIQCRDVLNNLESRIKALESKDISDKDHSKRYWIEEYNKLKFQYTLLEKTLTEKNKRIKHLESQLNDPNYSGCL